jgi:UDP-N-acetylglucosamine 4,6-dehydratase
MQFEKVTVMVTGGTGSFGRKFTDIMLEKYHPQKLIIFSRDELKQDNMRQDLVGRNGSVRFFIGDVRDRDRLKRAMHGVDIVVHAAAMKQVPACEYNPFEAVMTNVMGARNVIDAAVDARVERAILVSTDKAVNPVNLYGGTKLCAEKLFINGNAYSGVGGTKFSVVRYGNVVGSRGSVVPLFLAQRNNGSLTITDERMTRFWITLEQGVEFVIRSIGEMKGGEIFVPKIPSMRIIDMARVIAGHKEIKTIGIRPGEKINELLISEDEARHTLELEDRFIVIPDYRWSSRQVWADGKPLPEGFRYTSDGNTDWLSVDDFCTKLQLPPELTEGLKRVLVENGKVAAFAGAGR